ncbi:hypothetical protein NIA28_00925 [Coprococcus catus]|uniref:hypothetical protein n=1 Tax=Coprococcus catus TaxID=116085 RepID=UPI0020968903|nr:hypothetical protein [Coprococcus catus]MCO7144974.1 hypothetical protein [Coprococcus catus]
MKNIYDLLNQAEDNEDILSENERMEMTDIEKRRIYNRILLDSEEENRQEQAKKGRKAKKLLTAAACMAVICAVGFTAGAAVKEYLYKNTQSDYREKLDSTDSEAAADNTADNVIVDTADNTAENAIDGVDIRMTEVRMQEDSLTFDCTFTFDGDISEMQKEMEQWAITEGRNAIGDQLFDNAEVYVDGINVLDDDFNYVISQTDAFVIGQNVSFEENKMHIGFLIYQLTEGEDHTIQFCFNGLNMSDHTLEGSWKYTYEAKADAYEAELEWQDISIAAENQGEKITLNRYALTPNGPKIDATVEEKKGTDSIYEEDGYTKLDFMRIVAWDDLGNYYLMYGRSKDYNIDDSTIPYHQRFTIYDGSNGSLDGQENRDYKLVWDENASTVTFAMEKKTDKWDAETRKFVGADYEFVSEPYTVELVKN